MKEDFKNYLSSIGITTKAFSERIEAIYQFYQDLGLGEITGIFVTDYIQSDGARIFENLWFFTENCAMEAKQFPTQDNFEMLVFYKRIPYWNIKKQDYDFKKATDKSRLYLVFKHDTGIEGSFKASKENCDYLKEIFLKYILPNLPK